MHIYTYTNSGASGGRLYFEVLRGHGLKYPPIVITDAQRAAVETFVQLVLGKQKRETDVVCTWW